MSSVVFSELLEQVNTMKESTPDDEGGGTGGTEGVRHRRGSMGRDNTDAGAESEHKEKDYTEEQLKSVRRYYKIICFRSLSLV